MKLGITLIVPSCVLNGRRKTIFSHISSQINFKYATDMGSWGYRSAQNLL